MKLNGAKIILECLIEQGVDTLFGYPGGSVLDLYDALYDYSDKIRHIITCHEQGACHAADGYARASYSTGVVIATSGPGATNLVTGIANAYMDSVPLVAITGNVSLSLLGRDSFQEVDITGITMPITKQNYIIKRIEDLAPTVREAFAIASCGRKGPVLIDIPKNIFTEIAEYSPENPRIFNIAAGEEDDIKYAAELIAKSSRPLIFAGGGVVSAKAAGELSLLSKKIDSPICTSLMGIGVDTANPKHLGFAGMHGNTAANLAIKNCDLLIAVGTRFSDRVATNRPAFAKNAKVIHIDIDNAEVDKNITSVCRILGDCKETLPRLTDKLAPMKNDKWSREIAAFKQAESAESKPLYRLDPKDVIRTIASKCPPEQIIVTDVGQHQMWTAQHYPFKLPGTFITSGGLGTMGFGMGAAIGACTYTGKKTVLITGDGSFHMNMNELATAVKNKLPIVVAIFNNHVLGMVRQWQKLFYDSRFSQTSINNPTDYVALAKAFGADGIKATDLSALAKAMDKAIKSKLPFVIDIDLGGDENVLPMIPSGKSIDDLITSM